MLTTVIFSLFRVRSEHYILSSVGDLTTVDDADNKSTVRSMASYVSIVQCNLNTKKKP